MNERLQVISFTMADPDDTTGPPDVYFEALTDMVVVGVSAAGHTDDAGASTLSISDDGSAVITGIDVSDANVPGTWQARGYGGSEDPVVIAKDSLIKLSNTGGDAGIAILVVIYVLLGEDWK